MRFLFKTSYAQDIRLARHGGHVSVYGYVIIDQVAQAAQKAGPGLTTDSFVKTMDSITFEPDMFGSPRSS